jgi:hypothetical protein
MSNKTTFKRIALGLVAALGFGVLASGPSNAAIQSGATLGIASSTASIKAGETATAVLTATFTSIGAAAGADSMAVVAIQTGGTASSAGAFRAPAAADSASALAIARNGTNTSIWADATADKQVTATFRFDFLSTISTAAGTYTYTFYPQFTGGSGVTLPTPVTFAITVSAANTKPDATKSKVFITNANYPYASTLTDSAITAAAGTVGTNTAVGYIVWEQQNSAGSTSVLVPESVTVRITGAGAVGIGASTTKVSAVVAAYNETITVYSDGRTGAATITIDTTSMATWSTKTLTFSGTATKATIAVPRTNLGSYASSNAVRVTPRDSADNLVTTALNWYVHSSDTKVVANSTTQLNGSASYSLGYASLSLTGLIVDSGTAKIKLANYAADSTTPTTGAIVTDEVEVSVVGAAKTFTVKLDKAAYLPGEVAKVTITFLDGLGKGIADTAIVSALATGGVTANAATTSSGETITVAAATHGAGKYTYDFTMPSTSGNVVFKATGGSGLPAAAQVAVYETIVVTNPAEDAANSALDAAQEATDAAIAATDAAILAQEAADEAASAAIAAQETAQAAVDAVTALSAEVTKLVAQLATLQKLLNRVAKRVGVKL